MRLFSRRYLDQLISRAQSHPAPFSPVGIDVKQEASIPVTQITVPFSNSLEWIDVLGLYDVNALDELGKRLSLHYLILKDLSNTLLIPKVEYNEDVVLVVLKILGFKNHALQYEHLSFVLHKGGLISFQEDAFDTFSQVREKVALGKGVIHEKSGDYLLYVLLDFIMNRFFICLKDIDDEFSEIEKMDRNNKSAMNFIGKLQYLKKSLMTLKRYSIYTHQVLKTLTYLDHPLIEFKTRKYLNNLTDQMNHLNEIIATLSDDITDLIDRVAMEITVVSNQTMRRLTVVASVFMPLTLITGIYGMNFHYMPELSWRWGYFMALGFIAFVAMLLVLVYRKFDWF